MRLMQFRLWAAAPGASRQSVIRPSLVVALFFVAGQAFFYVFVLVANRILDPTAFGRFYAAWAALNVFVAPASVLAMVLMRYFAQVSRIKGDLAVAIGLRAAVSFVAPWVVAATIGVILILYIAGAVVGIDSTALIIVVPVTSAAIFAVEIVRAAYQGMLRFVWFGASWFAWCVAQCALGIGGLVFVGTVWAAYGGMLLASLLTLSVLIIPLRRLVHENAKAGTIEPVLPALEWRAKLPFCTALGGLVLLNNADIFVAYLTMDAGNLGAYSAAAVLPKALLTATQPIVQTIFPVVVHLHDEARASGQAVAKAVCLTLALAAAGAIILWGSGDLVCGGSYGIRFCSTPLMTILAAAAIPLSAARVWMTADLGRHRLWLPHLPVLAFLLFIAIGVWEHSSVTTLAFVYACVAWGVLAMAGLVKTAQWCRRRYRQTTGVLRSSVGE